MKLNKSSAFLLMFLIIYSNLCLGESDCTYENSNCVTFELISANDKKPIRDRRIVIYKKYASHQSYPYNESDSNWDYASKGRVDILTTDTEGRFILKLADYEFTTGKKATRFFLIIGEPYGFVGFSRSSNLSGTPSPNHLRILRFHENGGRVIRNDIYNIKQKTVKKITSNYDKKEGVIKYSETEEPYANILLITN